MINSQKIFALLALISLSAGASASVVQPDDGPYTRLRRGQILYVYDSVARESVPQIIGYMEAIRAGYDQSFSWKLDEEEDLVLTSPNQQVANAFARVNPNISSVWFPSGGAFLSDSAESSWFLALATHETAHLYQLNTKGPFNSFLKKIFGNAQIVQFPFFIPIFIQPNQFLPTFLVEGNAVFNESRANIGGRLHSGQVRALVLSQIKAGEVSPTSLINNEFKFPFGQNPYIQGGYFQAHLAAKHGVDKTNGFFLAQGTRWYWPFMLNRTFREHFGNSYPQEIHEYLREMQPLADKQQVSQGRVVAEALYFSPLNHDDKNIYFQAASGIYPTELRTFSKKGEPGSSERMDLPLGKVFYEDGKPQAASSEQNDLHHITYSLYGDGHSFDPRFANQVVSDQRAGKTVSLDAGGVWLDTHVLVNGEIYDVAHSLPILDSAGNVYYFRQNGAERILYKNRQSIFKFDGYYGKLTEVGADGGIYFIANTDSGSSLYEYKDKEIIRVLPSDVVIDARQIDDSRFLAIEVGAHGHRAIVTDAKRTPATPATYSYGFPSYNLKPEKSIDTEQLKTEERPYNALSQMRYSSLSFVSAYDGSNGLNGLIDATFVDPLEYHTLDLAAGGSWYGGNAFKVGYTFTKYLPQLFTQYIYQRQLWHSHDLAAQFAYNHQVQAGFQLPLLRWRRWDAAWSLNGVYNNSQTRSETSTTGTTTVTSVPAQETYGAFNSFTLSFLENPDPGIGFYPWQSFTLNYQNKLESEPGAWKKKYNTSLVQAAYTHGFPIQFYGTLSGDVAWAENHDINIYPGQDSLVQDIRIPRLVDHNYFTAKTASAARFEFTKVFDTPAYSPRIPFSLERVAPFVVAQGIFLDNDGAGFGAYPQNIFEWGFGADLQVLLFHLVHAKLRYLAAFDTAQPVHAKDGDQQLRFEAKYNF